MTPQEEKWLEEYRRLEAAETAKMQYRALWIWGVLFAVWAIILLFSEPGSKFTFSDSLLLMMIVINAGMAIRELIRSKRIAAGKKTSKRRTTTRTNHDNLKIK
ncbi:hypothetical protein [Alistipes sp.]|uniref:hypothetical protein n=1 Tax=Alistipes sp. TaxID=1872444 RepID=UPI003AB2C4FD